MQYESIFPARFLARPNRFTALCRLEDGTDIVCHVRNTGRCAELFRPGCRVWVQHNPSPTRKTAWTLITVDKDGVLEIPEGVDHGLLLEKLTDAGFRLEQEEAVQEALEQERHIVSVPAHDFDRRIKDNLDKLLAAKGGLIMAALGVGRLKYSEDHGYLAFDLYDSQPE